MPAPFVPDDEELRLIAIAASETASRLRQTAFLLAAGSMSQDQKLEEAEVFAGLAAKAIDARKASK